MKKPPNQDSQHQNQGEHLSRRPVSFLLLKVVVFVTVTLGTACILALIFKSQKILKPAASVETAVKPPIVQPVDENIKHIESKSKSNQQVSKGEAINLYQFPLSRQGIISPLASLVKGSHCFAGVKRVVARASLPGEACGVGWGDYMSHTFDKTVLPLKNPSKTPTDQERQRLTNSGKQTSYPSKMATAKAKTPVAHSQPQNQKNQQKALPGIPEIRNSSPLEAFPSGTREQEESVNAKTHENRPKQNQQESLPNARKVPLKLSDVVVLALQNNRTIKNAYLERIAQKQDLAVEENKFAPNFTPSVSVSMAQSGSDATTTTTNEVGLEAKMKVPTGGELSFGWTGNAPKISFNQPLLRGFGIDVNRASIETARLTEKSNVLGLKSTLSNTITDAILAYRNLLRAQERLKIEQLSLKSAQELLEINRVLIEAGRLAPVDIIQSQTAIANRQVSLVAAQNNLESTRLALLQILALDQNINIVPAEVPKASPVTLDTNKLRQLAFENQPEYLQAQLNLGRAKLDLLQAKNNRRWDLALNVSYDNTGDNATGDVRAGLTFGKTFGDLTPQQRFQRSRVNQLQAENNLKDLRESLEIQLTDRIRDVNLSFSQVQLARQARESSERQLEIQREKQRLGRGSGVFEIVSLENSLVEARNAELNATIEYLNALTNLDRTVGTTLDTWLVTIETNKK